MKELLAFEQVSYHYDSGGEREALFPLSVRLYEGEKIAVLGSNGAGKSTFFLLANGVLTPRSGTIRLCGEAIGKKEKQRMQLRRSVGLVFQDPDVQLLAGTVEEEISFGPINLGLPEEEVRRRVEMALSYLGLTAHRSRGPQYLSGGEKRRVAIADVLAMEPQVMLLDEPSSNLDPAGCQRLEDTLDDLHQKGMTLVIATHDVDFAWRWADRVLVFHDGQLVRDDTPEAVFAEEELLCRCGLEQPLLWRVAKALNIPVPKCPEELANDQIGRKTE